MFAHSRDPHPTIKLWCQVPFTKSKTTFQIEMYCMQCFLKSKYIKSRTLNDKNRWITKKVMVFKKLLQHLGTRGTYSPGDWRCDEVWREQTLVCHPMMCQQRLIYSTWELNVMKSPYNMQFGLGKVLEKSLVLIHHSLSWAQCQWDMSSPRPAWWGKLSGDIDDLVQDCSISSAWALEILQSCTEHW